MAFICARDRQPPGSLWRGRLWASPECGGLDWSPETQLCLPQLSEQLHFAWWVQREVRTILISDNPTKWELILWVSATALRTELESVGEVNIASEKKKNLRTRVHLGKDRQIALLGTSNIQTGTLPWLSSGLSPTHALRLYTKNILNKKSWELCANRAIK